VLNAVKAWQEQLEPTPMDLNHRWHDDDPFWGSSFFRIRQDTFLEMEEYNHAAIASQDFGAILA
jgi:hypothetical protein